VPDHNLDLLNLAKERHAAVIEADEKGKKAEELRKTEAAAAMAYTLAAVVSAQARMDAQAASAGAGAAGGLPPHLSPHP
jgi:glycerate kinase